MNLDQAIEHALERRFHSDIDALVMNILVEEIRSLQAIIKDMHSNEPNIENTGPPNVNLTEGFDNKE